MRFAKEEGLARSLLAPLIDRAGICIDGPERWDIQVHDRRFFRRVLLGGSLAFGESYVDGWWDCPHLDELVHRIVRADLDDRLPDWQHLLLGARGRLQNLQSVLRATEVAQAHYDLGNEFFAAMLGPTMCYSCGYWRDAGDLDAAQCAKMELISRKLGLRRGDRLLDIGCGFGSLLRHAAEHYGCEGVGITVSTPQCDWATARNAGLPLRFLVADYRSEEIARLGPFDRVVSVGMFEHVGRRNYDVFFRAARRLLRDDGLLLLQTIGANHDGTDPWMNRYIFPNGELPSAVDLVRAVRGCFVIEDWHNFRADYDRTILAWHDNFQRHTAPPAYRQDDRFRRMWSYYLLAFAGVFRAGTRSQLWQIVLSPGGVPGGYRSLR